ncbi:MAG TPA: hypothetical protein PLG23_08625 [Thermoflexales bacterium]|nr:hypothetical protein [Thermoflexales bacterium]HQX10066.1 hypothetical protein [Thermoflexales bacterium]HQY24103.1 hypothetical protein [Thermoflexales bacterium]HQZ53517.1 hypothetical protein [Thermoflexales bacterium]HRA53315.1 hypothetical protein [Thermoflexales bacterium]
MSPSPQRRRRSRTLWSIISLLIVATMIVSMITASVVSFSRVP